MHLGGLTHSAIHALGTWLVLVFFIGSTALVYALIDFVVHYHIDWAKVYLNKRYGWRPDNSNQFWILLGFDQLAHHITYFVIIYYAFQYQFT